jgi:glucan phosphoethanolaminetransferase (alkaline phosphatase superfamily)
MPIFIATVALIICMALAWLSKNRLIWRICWINVLIILIYNIIGWTYIFQYLDQGGESMGPGFLLLFGTIFHFGILFVVIVIMAMYRSVKEQGKSQPL